ncbi:group III truncated hemoglobin [Oceaniglobus ichthyenteri]|uniref:group III truncated hemoglobin n=1 Tax=Oceaniglobus ichthyenteri TaxID=2136177 RepID=UPI001F0CC562|nr:group III truncated hemoglobin [Oceaniglobus ichthyenteri]
MTDTSPDTPRIASARPEMTAMLMDQTGLNEEVLTRLVHRFYDRIRQDDMLGPIFAARITDWGPHLDRMVEFWSSVALMTGRYHGAPVPKHVGLPVTSVHFDRWLMLFRETAHQVCTAQGADHVILRAERIARSLLMAVQDGAPKGPGAVPNLR